MNRDISNIFWPFKDFNISLFKHYKDEDIVFVVQNQFIEHRKMFYHRCSNCNIRYKYEEYDGALGKINDPLLCKKCGSVLTSNIDDIIDENFIPGLRENFTSIWMHVLVQRYLQKLFTFCPKDEDKFQDYLIAFFRAVLNYNNSEYSGKVKFNTFFWRVIHNEACDDGREKTSSKKNPSIMCMVCGEKVGRISSDHLMNFSGNLSEGKDGFMGHLEFFKKVEGMYLDKIKNNSEKIINSTIRKKITSEYHHAFPDYPMEGKNVSLDDNISKHDEELSRRDVTPCEKQDPIIFDENATVFNSILFSDDDVSFAMEKFPELYEIAVNNKKIDSISRKYDNFENKHATSLALEKISKLVLEEFCNTDRGYTRKSIFFNEDNDYKNQNIIYDILDLHSHNYSIESIACFIGYDNIEKDDIKIILRILNKNPKCMLIAEEYLVPMVK